uniref:DNA-directed RNA polymerase III subunit RPC3 n=1 Tax=Oncorhynchus tshawytscha TaxID=74940 RepID=A0AAZ3PG29_ONCTS
MRPTHHWTCTVLVSSGRRGPGSPVEYRASCERVLRVLRYPRYIYTAKTLYGDTGELIVEEVLQRGHMTLSNTVKTVADRLTHNMEGRGKRRRSSDDSEEQRGGKKAKMDSESCGDEGIYCLVNFERFHQHFRDQAIISAVASKLDQTSGEMVRTMLRMSKVTTTQTAADTQPLSANEIFRSLPPNYSISRPILDQYLSLLVDDQMEFVGKSGDSGGGMYLVNLQRALANLARATLESAVQERSVCLCLSELVCVHLLCLAHGGYITCRVSFIHCQVWLAVG